MKNGNILLRTFKTAGLIFLLGVGMSACATGTDSWKEEVLLHDGQKIVIERHQTYGPRPVIDKWPKIKDQTLSFSLPGSTRELTWKSEYAEDIGGNMDFVPLALHVLDSKPYVVATPVGCLGYNKWGRPNPPYVVFMHDGNAWQRIPLTELPAQFRDINLVVGTSARAAEALTALPLVDVEAVRRFNSGVQPIEFKSILRGPVNYDPECIPMVTNGKGLWRAQAWFSRKPTLEACQAGCKSENFDDKTCPCNKIFEGK